MSNNGSDRPNKNKTSGETPLESTQFDASPDDIEIVGEAELNAKRDSKKATKNEKVLAEELNKAKNDYLYLRAEFDNYRKQAIKERSDLIKYGAERFIRELIDALDNFDRALEMEVNSANLDSFKEGVSLISSEFANLLERHGVKSVSSKGEAFDPSKHEALNSEETTEVEPGHIFREHKKSYLFHDRLLRPAQVIVAKEPSKKADAADAKE